MATYDFTHSCGHAETIRLVGPASSRRNKLAWLATVPCRDCERAALEKERMTAAQSAFTAASEHDLQPLVGSPKQIAWGETLRAEFLVKFSNAPDVFWKNILVRIGREDAAAIREEWKLAGIETPTIAASLQALRDALTADVWQWVSEQTNAYWWIDHRDMLDIMIAKAFSKRAWDVLKALAEGKDPGEEAARLAQREAAEEVARNDEVLRIAADQERKRAEATIRPAGSSSTLVADISLRAHGVAVSYPEPDETVNGILKRLGYRWDRPWWLKNCGAPDERAVEVGHRLLAAGVAVRIYDPELRRRAIAGEFEPERTRKIARSKVPGCAGWFVISWDRERDPDFYAEAKRIRGSHYERPFVVAPPSSWCEVQDFAEMHGFWWTPAAEEIVDIQRRAEEAVTHAAVELRPEKNPPTLEEGIPVLAAPEVVEVPAHLQDDL